VCWWQEILSTASASASFPHEQDTLMMADAATIGGKSTPVQPQAMMFWRLFALKCKGKHG
jgi:hypothetical protein